MYSTMSYSAPPPYSAGPKSQFEICVAPDSSMLSTVNSYIAVRPGADAAAAVYSIRTRPSLCGLWTRSSKHDMTVTAAAAADSAPCAYVDLHMRALDVTTVATGQKVTLQEKGIMHIRTLFEARGRQWMWKGTGRDGAKFGSLKLVDAETDAVAATYSAGGTTQRLKRRLIGTLEIISTPGGAGDGKDWELFVLACTMGLLEKQSRDLTYTVVATA